MNLAHDDWWPEAPGEQGGSLESLVCALEHEDGIGDLEGRAELDAHDLHNVGLGEQQEGLTVNHLGCESVQSSSLHEPNMRAKNNNANTNAVFSPCTCLQRSMFSPLL